MPLFTEDLLQSLNTKIFIAYLKVPIIILVFDSSDKSAINNDKSCIKLISYSSLSSTSRKFLFASLQVWLCIFLSSFVAGMATSFLEWHSPFGLNPKGRKRTKNYSLGSGLLMVVVLLTGHTINIKVG